MSGQTGPTFRVYIDESGDEGFQFGHGSSEWFVLSAIVTRRGTDLATVKLVDEVKAFLKKPKEKVLHFRDLKHEQRLPFVERIAKADLRAFAVVFHKPAIKEPEKFRERYRLYFFAVRYLFERISWYCRDHKTGQDMGDGSAEIMFSNRSGMSYEEMKDYIKLLKQRTTAQDIRIDSNVILENQIYAFSPGRRMGLQIADAVASSFYFAVEPRYGHVEDRYIRMMKNVVYNHQGTYWGYGVKVWPLEEERLKGIYGK